MMLANVLAKPDFDSNLCGMSPDCESGGQPKKPKIIAKSWPNAPMKINRLAKLPIYFLKLYNHCFLLSPTIATPGYGGIVTTFIKTPIDRAKMLQTCKSLIKNHLNKLSTETPKALANDDTVEIRGSCLEGLYKRFCKEDSGILAFLANSEKVTLFSSHNFFIFLTIVFWRLIKGIVSLYIPLTIHSIERIITQEVTTHG